MGENRPCWRHVKVPMASADVLVDLPPICVWCGKGHCSGVLDV